MPGRDPKVVSFAGKYTNKGIGPTSTPLSALPLLTIWNRPVKPLATVVRTLLFPVVFVLIWMHQKWGWEATSASVALYLYFLWFISRLCPCATGAPSAMARAAIGQRMWLNRYAVTIPQKDHQLALLTSIVMGSGIIGATIGALDNVLWLSLLSTTCIYAARIVQLILFVSLFQKMKNKHPIYRSWAMTPQNDNHRQHQQPTKSL
ncbi:DUF6653 family protein [Polycladidibacter stylochi]|uniref:DUF6653 family protein n=1 Tax=Polycladidibacter stylochi TaxID=1807766 RepID=UPI000ABF4533|nr:DUF6653 family protein [Pseudovibrio stylochi]